MKKELHSVYLEYLSKLRGQVISEFDVKVEQVIPDDENEILSNFAEVMNKLRSEALTAFENKGWVVLKLMCLKFHEQKVKWNCRVLDGI